MLESGDCYTSFDEDWLLKVREFFIILFKVHISSNFYLLSVYKEFVIYFGEMLVFEMSFKAVTLVFG